MTIDNHKNIRVRLLIDCQYQSIAIDWHRLIFRSLIIHVLQATDRTSQLMSILLFTKLYYTFLRNGRRNARGRSSAITSVDSRFTVKSKFEFWRILYNYFKEGKFLRINPPQAYLDLWKYPNDWRSKADTNVFDFASFRKTLRAYNFILRLS